MIARGTGRPILLVSGLSGAGKSSILRVLEDLGYEAVDNPPLDMIDAIIRGSQAKMAIGVDARTKGFDSDGVLGLIDTWRADAHLHPELLFAVAAEDILLRRYTATRRRHPLAREGCVLDGIATETRLTASLRDRADLVLDTSDMLPAELRSLIEARYAAPGNRSGDKLKVSLISFASPAGLPRESDMVFDARFLRNPFYHPILSSKTGLDPEVVSHVETDPAYRPFLDSIHGLLRMLLPRFVTEGKKYVTVAIGCSGGRHRSVALVEALAQLLRDGSQVDASGDVVASEVENEIYRSNERLFDVRLPILVMHRELSRAGLSALGSLS